MNTKEYLDRVAYVKKCEIDGIDDVPDAYYSKFDDSYITFIGLEEDIKHLAEREITEELTHGVGLSLKDKKWYGWSHRAIYGFEIGSECKKGACHYTPEKGEWTAKTMGDAKQMAKDFNAGVS